MNLIFTGPIKVRDDFRDAAGATGAAGAAGVTGDAADVVDAADAADIDVAFYYHHLYDRPNDRPTDRTHLPLPPLPPKVHVIVIVDPDDEAGTAATEVAMAAVALERRGEALHILMPGEPSPLHCNGFHGGQDHFCP